MEKPEVRREAAIRYIREGAMRGYLAYEGDTVVGWCSANDRNASRKCFGVRWIIGGELPETEEKAMSVFCFEVAPAKRGRHVAATLLSRVIEDAGVSGCEFVEAYPLKESPQAVTENYGGHIALYEKYGFRPIGETQNGHMIMRKML
jgi:ribosomal protein S18 acetylase RimI-like enzyme